MRNDDALMDEAYPAYLRARGKAAKAQALCELLRVSEPFIGRIVRHLSRGAIRELEPEEAMQQARIGFLDSVRRADPKLGPLRPFAISRIRHELQTLAEVSYGIKVPRRSGLPAGTLRGIERLWSKEGREPTEDELGEDAKAYAESSTRPRVVTSLDAPSEGHSLADLLASETLNPLEVLLEKEETGRATPEIANAIEAALTRPVVPTPRKKPIAMLPTSPLDKLSQAFADVQAHLRGLEDREAEIRKERLEMKATLAKVTGEVPVTDPRPVIAINQDKLPHRVAAFLKSHPESRVSVIAKAVNDTSEAVGVVLTKLRASGLVVARGKARGTSYSMSK